MKWSIHLGNVFGIEVRLHYLFLAFLALFLLLELIFGSLLRALINLLLVCLTFVFVFLHELGHSLMAIFYRIRVHSITLWPLGGIASMEQIPQDPRKEIYIALAGPIVNMFLAFLFSPFALLEYVFIGTMFFTYIVVVNLILMSFNLIPAFPMDGGRIYRAWQAQQLGYLEATRKAVSLGTKIAIVMGILGLFNIILLFIALFIFIAGQEELKILEREYELASSKIFGWQVPHMYLFSIHPDQPHRPSYHSVHFFTKADLEKIAVKLRQIMEKNSHYQ